MELSILTRQCLTRRFEDSDQMSEAIAAWQTIRNEKALGATWRFTTTDARVKLKGSTRNLANSNRQTTTWLPHLWTVNLTRYLDDKLLKRPMNPPCETFATAIGQRYTFAFPIHPLACWRDATP